MWWDMKNTKLSLCSLLFCVLAALCFGCRTDTDSDFWSTVIGTVTDSISGAPLEGAEIFVDDTLSSQPWSVTDSTGRYEVSNLGYANWTIYCRAEGYATKNRHVRGTGTIKGIDFEM
jgi:hypothetical protein